MATKQEEGLELRIKNLSVSTRRAWDKQIQSLREQWSKLASNAQCIKRGKVASKGILIFEKSARREGRSFFALKSHEVSLLGKKK